MLESRDRRDRKLYLAISATVLVCILVTCTVIHFTMVNVNSVTDKESLYTVEENTLQIKYALETRISDTWDLMTAINGGFAVGSDNGIKYTEADAVKYLQKVANNSRVTKICLMDADAFYIDSYGRTGEWAINEAMFPLINEKKKMCAMYKDPDSGDQLLFAMPISSKSIAGHDMEYLIATFDLDSFLEVLKLESYSGNGYIRVVDLNGLDIFHSSPADIADNGYYLYAELKNARFEHNDDIKNSAALKQFINKRQTGAVCAFKDTKQCMVGIAPLNSMDWTVVLEVESSILLDEREQNVKLIGNVAIILLVFVMLLTGFIVIAIVSRSSKMIYARDSSLKSRDKLFELLSMGTYDAFVMFSLDSFKVDYVSPNTEDVLGISAESIRENVLSALQGAQYADGNTFTVEQINNIEENGAFVCHTTRIHEKTGEKRWFTEDIYRRRIDGIEKCIVVISDRTDEENSKKGLEDALDIAKAANDSKSNFLANMSHDIRTPMNAITGFSNMLIRDAEQADKVREYAQKISFASKHLLSLINDILDMSKIESGKTTLTISEFLISELVESVDLIIRPQTKTKNQTFNVNVVNVRADRVLGDELRIRQILLNLLSNAVKYTPDGGSIELEISGLPKRNADTQQLSIRVKDTGRGMSHTFLKELYNPFSRAPEEEIGDSQGTGLGMAITKGLVDLMGGTIKVDSELKKGTTFIVQIGLKVVDDSDSEELVRKTPGVAMKLDNQEFAGKKFLVVEDNLLNAEILCDILGNVGATYEVCENGSLAVDRFITSGFCEFDLIFMDIQMPVMNGYDAARAIRASGRSDANEIPIVALTANAFPEDIQLALEAGMNAHLAKPFDMENIIATINALII